MPSKHKGHPTISFRPSSWERNIIEQRAELCGYYKKDFIARSCVYSNIVVLGSEENMGHIVDKLEELQSTLSIIARQMLSGDIVLSEESFYNMRDEYLAVVITVIDIINGTSYLYEKDPINTVEWKKNIKSFFDK